MSLRLGSLFSGYGGLDLAVEEVFGARTVWNSDIEPGPRKVLAHRFPDVPNLGDITTVDWSQVEPVDIIAGGSPCTDISSAGRMAGMYEGTRSNLWVCMRDAIEYLQPAVVVWENVRGASSARAASAMESDPRLLGDHPAGVPVLRALGRVLGDLASLGFDAEWHSLRAADVGAPHGRARYFVVAVTRDPARRADVATHPENFGHQWSGDARLRWPGPAHGRKDRPKLNPEFASWMMGVPAGWITDVPGVSDNESLKMAGNGVVPQQAVAALRTLLAHLEALGGAAVKLTKPSQTPSAPSPRS